MRERKNKEGREKGMVRCNNRGGGGNCVLGKAVVGQWMEPSHTIVTPEGMGSGGGRER